MDRPGVFLVVKGDLGNSNEALPQAIDMREKRDPFLRNSAAYERLGGSLIYLVCRGPRHPTISDLKDWKFDNPGRNNSQNCACYDGKDPCRMITD